MHLLKCYIWIDSIMYANHPVKYQTLKTWVVTVRCLELFSWEIANVSCVYMKFRLDNLVLESVSSETSESFTVMV